jgi:hypothetical protein
VTNALAKNDWLAAEQCLAMGWYGRRAAGAGPNEGTLFRMQQGQEIGAFARQFYTDGVLVTKSADETAVDVTQALINDATKKILFEAAFAAGPFRAKADVLERVGDGWHVLEVKSSFSDTSRIDALVADLAYTTMVLRRAGLKVIKASLLLLSRNFRYGMGVDRLFETIDKSEDVNGLAAHYESRADAQAKALLNDQRPAATLTSACRGCEFFASDCLGAGHAHTVLELPNLHHTKFKKLAAAGVVSLFDIPEDFELTERQQRVRDSALTGQAFVDPGLPAKMQNIESPCHYLDFETVATVMPLYEGHGCHQQVLTQFSVHHRADPTAACTHSEFLVDVSKTDERQLAEALIAVLGNAGSIIVYSSFEKTRIKALQTAFTDLSEPLERILGRLVDLNALVSANFYHPDFRGSFSIKTVLPTLVPDLSYAELAIADGDTAVARFARMAKEELSAEEVQTIRTQLLEYCGLDTLAMVRLHEVLRGLAV